VNVVKLKWQKCEVDLLLLTFLLS